MDQNNECTKTLEEIRNKNKERQKRYYEKNKEKILNKRKEIYKLGKERIITKPKTKEIEIQTEPEEEIKNEKQRKEIGTNTQDIENKINRRKIINEMILKENPEEKIKEDEINKEISKKYINNLLKLSNKDNGMANLSLFFNALEKNNVKIIDILNNEEKLIEFYNTLKQLKHNDTRYSLSTPLKIFESLKDLKNTI